MSDQVTPSGSVATATPSSPVPAAPTTQPSAPTQHVSIQDFAQSNPSEAQPPVQDQWAGAPAFQPPANSETAEGDAPTEAAEESDPLAELDGLSDEEYYARLEQIRKAEEDALKLTVEPSQVEDERIRTTLEQLIQEREQEKPYVDFARQVQEAFDTSGRDDAPAFMEIVGHLLAPDELMTYGNQKVERGVMAAYELSQRFPSVANDLVALTFNAPNPILQNNYAEIVSALQQYVPEFSQEFMPRSEASTFLDSNLKEEFKAVREQLQPKYQPMFDKATAIQQERFLRMARNGDYDIIEEKLEIEATREQGEMQRKEAQQRKEQAMQAERQRFTNQTIQKDTYGMLEQWQKTAKVAKFSDLESAGLAAMAFQALDADTYKPGTKANQLFEAQYQALHSGDMEGYRKAKREYEKLGVQQFTATLRKHAASVKQQQAAAPAPVKPKASSPNAALVEPARNTTPQFEVAQPNAPHKPMSVAEFVAQYQ